MEMMEDIVVVLVGKHVAIGMMAIMIVIPIHVVMVLIVIIPIDIVGIINVDGSGVMVVNLFQDKVLLIHMHLLRLLLHLFKEIF